MSNTEAGMIGFDIEFFKSTDGVFKLVQLLLSLLLLIFVASSDFSAYEASYIGFALFVAILNFISLLLSVIIYAFKLYNGLFLDRLPWRNTELLFAAGSALLNFVGMICCAVAASNHSLNGLFAAGAVFSALITVAFLLYAFVIYRGNVPRSEAQDR